MDSKDQGPSAAVLTQVLNTLNDLRDRMEARFAAQGEELARVRERFSEMATKEDLKQFITRDLADARETSHNERMNAMDGRQQRLEDRVDALREDHYQRQIENRTEEKAEGKADEHRTSDERQNLLQRANDRVWMILTLVLSPLVWMILNYLMNHH